jgi:HNH endonuclease
MAIRKAPKPDVRQLVLHEAGYKCGNPICRHVITLDVHHLDPISSGGGNGPDNLLALCPNCHALHHAKQITETSLRAWKLLLLALNEAFDRRSVDIILSLDKLGPLYLTGDGILECAGLVASGLAEVRPGQHDLAPGAPGWDHGGPPLYTLTLSNHGRNFVDAWKDGRQDVMLIKATEA